MLRGFMVRYAWPAIFALALAPQIRAQEDKGPAATPNKADKQPAPGKVSQVPNVELTIESGDVLLQDVQGFVLSVVDEQFWLGMESAPADEALRSQLALPKGQGLVVKNVEPGSPADEAGLQAHDVLLTIAGHAVDKAAALRKQVEKLGEKPAAIVFLRGGKKLTVELKAKKRQPLYSEVLLHSDGPWVGVSVAIADDTLRSQLRLAEKRGLIVTKVEPDSPAAKGGIQLHDVLLEFGGKPLATVEDLNAQIREVGEKPATMKLLRGGAPTTCQVTATKRPSRLIRKLGSIEGVNRAIVLDLVPEITVRGELLSRVRLKDKEKLDPQAELANLVKETKALVARLEALEEFLKKDLEKSTKSSVKPKK